MPETALDFFDAKAALGRFVQPTPWSTPEALLQAMDQYGIAEALVFHSQSCENHPIHGNQRVLELTEGNPRLHPAWSLLPPKSRDIPDVPGTLAEGLRRGVRAVFVFPRHYFMTIEEFTRGGAFAGCEEWGVPVIVDPCASPFGGMDEADWRGLRFLLEAHPRLPVIHTEFRLRTTQRTACHLLEDHPNLYLDVACCWNYRSVEFFAREFGVERLVAGTGMPFRDPGQTVAMVTLAELPEEARRQVAGGNLRRLLAKVEVPR